MKKWQHERNYRMIKVNNQVIAYQISVEGKSIEVTKEVYQAYAQMDRRERYLKEADMTVGLLCIPELLDRQAEPAEEDDNTSIDGPVRRRKKLRKSSTSPNKLSAVVRHVF